MKIKVVFDTVKYTNKPKNAGAIINRMKKEMAREYSIEEIKEKIIQGYTIRPANCGAKNNEWESQQVFMIDIDNEARYDYDMILSLNEKIKDGKDDIVRYLVGSEYHKSYQNIIEYCNEINMFPNFIYTSFSHSDKQHKFRLVFILDKEIANKDIASKVQLYIISKFDGCDSKCKNLNRIYYGGKNIVYDSGKLIDRKWIIEESKKYIDNKPKVTLNPSPSPKSSEVTYNMDTENILALRKKDMEYLKNLFSRDKIIFETRQQFLDYIRTEINLPEFLGIENYKSFNCLFHNDKNPSAGIFQADDGAWLYKCFSCGVVYNIINLIEMLANTISRFDTYKFIMEIFNIEIMESEWQKQQKEILESFLETLYSEDFRCMCPQASKNISRSIHYLDRLVHIAMKNIYNEKYTDEDNNAVFFASASYIAKEMGLSEKSVSLIYQKIALFAYHKLVNKLDYRDIPKELLDKVISIANKNNHKNIINCMSIPSLITGRYDEIEKRGKEWKKNHYTMKGISREMFYRAEGKEIANEIYPQFKTIDYTLDGKDVSIERTTTNKSNIRTNNITKVIFELIKEKGYASNNLIKDELKLRYRYNVTELQIRKSIGSILNDYNLQRVRTNKKLKDKYKIDSNGYPFIIIKK